MYLTKHQANQELKKIMRDFLDSYKSIGIQSRDNYIKTLAPGSPLPKEGIIYGEYGKELFSDKCREYRNKAHQIVDFHLNETKRKETEAPSTEAVNSITLLKLRDDVTEKDISDLLDRYGENPQAYRAINSVAREHKILSFGDHPISQSRENLETLSASIDKAISPGNEHISDGFVSIFDMTIDSAFPEE